jgi:hypothetical protein
MRMAARCCLTAGAARWCCSISGDDHRRELVELQAVLFAPIKKLYHCVGVGHPRIFNLMLAVKNSMNRQAGWNWEKLSSHISLIY